MHAFDWAAPVTSTFLMELELNCDIPYYSSVSTDAQDRSCSAAFDVTISAETRDTVVQETSVIARDQELCVLDAGSTCQASFISNYERQQHAYLMYVTAVSEERRAGALVDVLVNVRVQAADDDDGMEALKGLTPTGVGCGHRRMADGASSPVSDGSGSLAKDSEEEALESKTELTGRIRELELVIERLKEELRSCKAEVGSKWHVP